MDQLDHPASVVAVVGSMGSGKTSWAASYIANHKARLRFIFDPEGEFSNRFRVRPARTPAGLDEALKLGWVCYQPGAMFPQDDDAGLAFFAAWSVAVSERCGGTKLFVVDEFQEYVSPNFTPPALKQVIHRGRRRGIDTLTIGQSPMEIGAKLRKQLTAVVTYRFHEPGDLDWLEAYGFDPERVRALPQFGRLVRDRWGREKYEGPSVRHAAAPAAVAKPVPSNPPQAGADPPPAPVSAAPEG